jgi:hypothetical protein
MPNDKVTDQVIQNLLDGKPINDIELTDDDKTFLFAKGKDFKAEAEYFETYESDAVQANKLYDIADKLWDIGKDETCQTTN